MGRTSIGCVCEVGYCSPMVRDSNTRLSDDFAVQRQAAERRWLVSYAADASNSRGRLFDEPESPTRSPFQRDRDRIIHSDAFRRLKHKTQVFVHHEGDHYRTRLTHSIEVGQIARALARAFAADEDLAEALALVHDFGHTPFGHAGERTLNDKMAAYGGFDHNAQALRVVTRLERRYAQFDGLNLCWETLEGLVKHNGPLTDHDGDGLDGPVSTSILEYNAKQDLELWSWPSVEAQCAAIADDIAYDNHDLDDGLRAELFDLSDLADVPICAAILDQVRDLYPQLDAGRTAHELIRRQITLMVEDVIGEATARLNELASPTPRDIAALDYAVVRFSPAMEEQEKTLKAFLFQRMYRHPKVMKPVEMSQQIIGDLFDTLMSGSSPMPDSEEWSLAGLDEAERAERVVDYLAGMTDRFAVREHQRMFDHTPDLG
ncbi:MAG: deoxyguanosinetriphosphate triphosphohydrolase [Pseudomonadota bacterium]